MNSNRLTKSQVDEFLSKHNTKEKALEFLQSAGLVDEHGNLTRPYQPTDPLQKKITNCEQQLDEYNKELKRESGIDVNITMGDLIRQSREFRNMNKDLTSISFKAQKDGYEAGYKRAVSEIEEDTIMLENLRKMTIQELTNLIWEEYD